MFRFNDGHFGSRFEIRGFTMLLGVVTDLRASCALCCMSVFGHYRFILMLEKNPDSEAVPITASAWKSWMMAH